MLALLLVLGSAACGADDPADTASDGGGAATEPDASDGAAPDGGATSGPGGDAGLATAPCVPPAPTASSPPRCSDDGSDPSLPRCGEWAKVEPQGAVCSDGSPYKFFVNYTNESDSVLVMFEPGGACWDYESCKGRVRSAANRSGIRDDHMSTYQYLNLLRRTPDNPARSFNFVFVSYCTGDVHTGDRVATYDDPAGGPPLTYRHVGLANTRAVLAHLRERFTRVPQLLMTGCSAGGVGALQHYALFRNGLRDVSCGYLLNDSGPPFHTSETTRQSQETVDAAWNLDAFYAQLAPELGVSVADLRADAGRISTALADRYPRDRLALAAYRMDLNYSLYLYERFFPEATPADIHAMFWADLEPLLRTYDARPNLSYYIPYFRSDNCSHCVSIPPLDHDPQTILSMPWLGSDIASEGLDMRGFVTRLLDDARPLESYVEAPRPEADLTPAQLAACLMP